MLGCFAAANDAAVKVSMLNIDYDVIYVPRRVNEKCFFCCSKLSIQINDCE